MDAIKMTESRLDYVDLIRGFGILTVVFVHTNLPAVLPSITAYFSSFHMFLFFFISGFIFKKERAEDYGKYGEKLALRLLVPYIVFSVINWYVNQSRGESLVNLWSNSVYANLAFGAIWFLPAQFVCCMTGAYVIKKIRWDWLACLLGLLSLAVGYVLVYRFGIYFLRFPQGLIGVLFFICGYQFRKHLPQIPLKYEVLVGGVLVVLGGITFSLNKPVHLSRMELGILPLTIFSAICTITGLFLLLRTYKAYTNPIAAYVRYIGQNSLTVLCTHSYVLYSVMEIYKQRLMNTRTLSMDYLLVLVVSMVVQTMILLLWNGVKKYIKNIACHKM